MPARPTRVPACFARIPAGGSLSVTPGILPFAPSGPASPLAPLLRRSACPRESNQREGHPNVAPAGHPARRVRRPRPGSVDSASMRRRRNRAHPCARPCGPLRPRPAATQGVHSEAARSCAPKRKPVSCGRAFRPSYNPCRVCLGLGSSCDWAVHWRAQRAALDLPPSAPVDGGRNSPQGRREGSRCVRCQHRDVLSANPGRRPRTPGRRPGAALPGAVLFGDFLFRRESHSPAGMRAKPAGTRGGPSRKTRTDDQHTVSRKHG